jgi:hypothetical protein
VEIVDLLLTLKANPSLHLDVCFQQAYELCEKGHNVVLLEKYEGM